MTNILNNTHVVELPTPNYKYITSTEEAKRCLEIISRYPIIEVDTETTGLDVFTSKVVLLQLGVHGQAFIFDIREGRVDVTIFKSLLEDESKLKLLQNAIFDYKMLQYHYNIKIKNIYDLMLAEQLLYLGLNSKSNLGYLVNKYLHLYMPKDSATSFEDYGQEYNEHQLRYAANDVSVLQDIYNLQLMKLKADGLTRVAKLEFECVKPLAEMELNGMLLDVQKWRSLIVPMVEERNELAKQISSVLNQGIDQTTLFGVSLVNLDSPIQMVKVLNKLGIPVTSTDIKELKKYKNNPVIELFLKYRKYEKFITTYGEPMIAKINPVTNRLHTSFKQMVATGRMSSSDPNLQNIPKEQVYRSCFIARPGYKLITADMDGAELRIIADMSGDPTWINIFNTGGDLHTVSAAFVFGVSEEEVINDKNLPADDKNKKDYRTKSKPLSFGLAYGLTASGLALRLGISKAHAQEMIDKYFSKYKRVHQFLERSGKRALLKRYSLSVSGRRRYFRLPPPSDPSFNMLKGSVERAGKNHPIQAGNADTIKQALIYASERIEGYDARLLLTVHDEMIVEVREDQAEEVKDIIGKAIIDGFGEFFKKVPMTCTPLVGDCWLKG